MGEKIGYVNLIDIYVMLTEIIRIGHWPSSVQFWFIEGKYNLYNIHKHEVVFAVLSSTKWKLIQQSNYCINALKWVM